MRRKRRNHSPEFKAKVALATLQGDLTMAELVKKFDVHANQIADWKKQLLSNASDVFGKGAQKAEESAETIEQLHAKIGQLTMENGSSGSRIYHDQCGTTYIETRLTDRQRRRSAAPLAVEPLQLPAGRSPRWCSHDRCGCQSRGCRHPP